MVVWAFCQKYLAALAAVGHKVAVPPIGSACDMQIVTAALIAAYRWPEGGVATAPIGSCIRSARGLQAPHVMSGSHLFKLRAWRFARNALLRHYGGHGMVIAKTAVDALSLPAFAGCRDDLTGHRRWKGPEVAVHSF